MWVRRHRAAAALVAIGVVAVPIIAATYFTTPSVAMPAVYVSYSRGSAGNTGTAGAPLLTVQAGINVALNRGPPFAEVLLESGTFPASGTVTLREGVNVSGGLDPVSWKPIQGGLTTIVGAASGGTLVASARMISAPTAIQRIRFQAPDATNAAGASIALRAKSCTSALTFTDCEFVAGNGRAGGPAAAGEPGPAGTAAATNAGGAGFENGRGGVITSSPGGVVNASGNWSAGKGGTAGGDGGGEAGGGGGGEGATNGGASFAVHLHDSSPVFVNCAFKSGRGGDGGLGGGGGPGGSGGHGGGGAGGHGGPSWCLYKSGTTSAPELRGTRTLTVGAGGRGGAGGSTPPGGHAGQSGNDGPSGTIN